MNGIIKSLQIEASKLNTKLILYLTEDAVFIHYKYETVNDM